MTEKVLTFLGYISETVVLYLTSKNLRQWYKPRGPSSDENHLMVIRSHPKSTLNRFVFVFNLVGKKTKRSPSYHLDFLLENFFG